MVKKEWIEKGFVDEPVDATLDLKQEIRRLCKEKDAIILAHYYTVGDIQDIADFVGDSLALARKAAETDAKVMVMCGVHFMAETCKLLSPDKTVLCPDLNAGCSPGFHLPARVTSLSLSCFSAAMILILISWSSAVLLNV